MEDGKNEEKELTELEKLNRHIDARVEERSNEIESKLTQKFAATPQVRKASEWDEGEYEIGEGRAFSVGMSAMFRQWQETGSTRGFETKVEDEGYVKRFLGTGSQGGGNTIPEPLAADIIPELYKRLVLVQAGAVKMPMNSKKMTIGRQNAKATATHNGENSAPAQSGPGFDQIELDVKKLTGLAEISQDILRTGGRVGTEFVAEDLMKAVAQKMEETIFRGEASSTVPGGIFGQIAAGNKFELVGGTPTATEIEEKLDDCEKAVLDANVNPANIAAVIGDRDYLYLRRLRDNGVLLYPELRDGEPSLVSKRAYRTNVVAEDAVDAAETTGVDDLSRIYMGDFSAVLIGILTDMELSFSEHAEFAADLVLVKLVTHYDAKLRRDADISVLSANFSA